jgi:hypothetical protein
MDNLLQRIAQAVELNAKSREKNRDNIIVIKEAIGDPDAVDKPVLELAIAELYAFQFTISSNELKPMFVWTDKNGMTVKEPNIENFSEEQLTHLKERLKNSVDVTLRARYSHILWLSKARKIEHGKEAIDCYFTLLKEHAENDIANPGNDHWLNFLEVTRNLFALSLATGYKVEETKGVIIRFAKTYSLKSSAASVVRKDLADLMRENKQVFKVQDLEGIVNALKEGYDTVEEKDLHHAIDILETILSIEQKLGNDLVHWKRLVAEGWEKIARNRGVDAALVTTNFCMKAVLAYEEIGDKKKVSELYDFYAELREHVELSSFPFQESKEAMKMFDVLSDALLNNESDGIIQFLMIDKKVIPQKNEIVNSFSGENAFLKDVLCSVFDQNGNTNRHYSSESEKNTEELIFGYAVWINYHAYFVQSIILKAVRTGKLTYDKVLNYLYNFSWYGQELKIGKRKDVRRTQKWLSVVAPGIVDFFFAIDGMIYSKKIFNITTSFDSLTMKIEGIVRTLAEFHGVHTFVIKRDNLGREVSEEMDIMKLLTHPKIVEFIGEDDIFFLRFVFTEKGGLNLRNKVAHSLLGFDQYSIGYLMLIFVAILRLGKYQLTE